MTLIERLLKEIDRVAGKYSESQLALEALQEIQNWAIEETVADE